MLVLRRVRVFCPPLPSQGYSFVPESSRKPWVSPIFISSLVQSVALFPKMYRGQVCSLASGKLTDRHGHVTIFPSKCLQNGWFPLCYVSLAVVVMLCATPGNQRIQLLVLWWFFSTPIFFTNRTSDKIGNHFPEKKTKVLETTRWTPTNYKWSFNPSVTHS